ncbi:hypothetical protein AC579_198 [Pseudocercospora musae]|uniref:Small ribosomal subunit protein bS18m n=1 Tax=Pseudocercospora musae TaxID=113226 RepID=A0A139HYQ4_9PEZI|nr:hypothetical protein AC579_198 [Pseudocercospora musae]
MSLEHAFTRLSVKPSSICRQCRRSLATSSRQQQQNRRQSATAAFADLLQSNRSQAQTQTAARTPASASPSSPQGPLGASASTASPKTPSPTSTAGWSMMQDAVKTATEARKETVRRQMLLDQERGWNRQDLERQASHRRWKAGDVYAPHDLTGVEMAKWKKLRRKPKPRYDVIDRLGLNPLDHYKNFSIMSEYMTEMGRIKHSNDTNLRPVNQRKMAKAIRRAVGLGILMPGTHRHPEILRIDMNRGR